MLSLLASKLLLGIVAMLLMFGTAPPANAASMAQLHEARAKLAVLTGRIQAQERALAETEDRLRRLDLQVDKVVRSIEAIRQRVRVVRTRVAALRAQAHDLQEQMNELANSTFVGQPGGQLGTVLGVLMGARSYADIADGFQYADRLSDQANAVAAQLSLTDQRLATRLASLQELLSTTSSLLGSLTAKRRHVHQLQARHQQALRSLDATRTRMIEVVRTLRHELALDLFPMIGTAFQGEAHTSYGRWSVLLLHEVGAPACRSNEVVVIAWQLAEFTQAAWNPLATTKAMPGSTTFNDAGVRDYPSLGVGLAATRLTLELGASSYGYGPILADLRACAPPYSTAHAIQASSWCHGCADGGYVVNKIAEVAADFELYAAF
jgi:peptidoglycan hydrolase CwlO-like protein